MSLNRDPSKIKRYQSLIIFLIVAEVPLGLWLSIIASEPGERIIAGAFILAVVIAFSLIFGVPYLIKRDTHHPKVIVTFSPLKLAVDLDSKKCKYRILKKNAEEIASGNVAPVPGGEESWQIIIPKDVSSDTDTIELTLVDKSNTTWKTKLFYPYVTKQTATAEDEKQ